MYIHILSSILIFDKISDTLDEISDLGSIWLLEKGKYILFLINKARDN